MSKRKTKEGRNEKGHFAKGNQIQRLTAKRLGRTLKYSPDSLLDECVRYFEHVDNNPFVSHEITTTSKGQTTKEVYHRKPYQWMDLYCFLEVCDLEYYKTKSEFYEVLKYVDNKIYSNKSSGAYSGIYNANFAARDLGLTDKTESKNETTVIEMTDDERERRIDELKKKMNG